jgi:hypothetical protein
MRSLGNAMFALLALALAVTALLVARDAANRSPGFTELSSLPAQPGPDPALSVMVVSHQHRASGYLLVVREDGRPVLSRALRLEAGESWHVRTAAVARATREVSITLLPTDGAGPSLQTTYRPPRAAQPVRSTRSHARRRRKRA